MRPIIITGKKGVGKSTLIRALLGCIDSPVYGVITKKEAVREDGYAPVFIHLYGEEQHCADENCIGMCRDGSSIPYPDAFDRFAEKMLFPSDGVMIFDELGFLESSATRFIEAVYRILDTAPFVIAAVRDKDTPFLNAIRNHPRADVFTIDTENRDAVRELLKTKLSGTY